MSLADAPSCPCCTWKGWARREQAATVTCAWLPAVLLTLHLLIKGALLLAIQALDAI